MFKSKKRFVTQRLCVCVNMRVHIYQIVLFVALLFTLFYLIFVHSLTTTCKIPSSSTSSQSIHNSIHDKEISNVSNILYKIFPKVIYRTNNSLRVSRSMKAMCHDKWIEMNQGFTMKWFTDEDVEKYMKTMPERVYNAYKSLQPGAYKADLWRMCILYENGGYYFDSYCTPMESIHDMLKSLGPLSDVDEHCNQYMVSVRETIDKGVHQGVLMVTPEHPFLFACIQQIVKNVENKYYGNTPWDITGPTCFYQCIVSVLLESGFEVDNNQENFLLGENRYEDLSFYLFKFTKPMQHVKTIKYETENELQRERVVLKKKFSQLQHIYRKHLHENTYADLWKKQSVYPS